MLDNTQEFRDLDQVLMDRVVYKIINWDFTRESIVLWGDNKTIRIPIYFITNVHTRHALGIKFILK